jgi:hypothetical protein
MTEDEKLMHHARSTVVPTFNQYFSRMQEPMRELCDARKVEGRRVRELPRLVETGA